MPPASDRAVFLSYASQDAEAAQRICEALRGAGVEVWFDQNELVGGDAWDAKIRKQIAECALFVPLISANTQARLEGYFRIEWKLAAQRTHAMAEEKSFLLPVLIDATRDSEAKVPAEFKTVQWTKLLLRQAQDLRPADEAALEKFCARVKTLLGGEEIPSGSAVGAGLAHAQEDGRGRAAPLQKPSRSWSIPAIIGVGLLVAVAAFFALRPRRSSEEVAKLVATSQSSAADTAAKSTLAAPPLTEAQKLTRQARALIEDDPLAVRENFLAAERLCQRAVMLDPADSEAWAIFSRAGMALIADYYDRSPGRLEIVRSRAETALRLQPDSIEAGLAIARYELYALPRDAGDAPMARLQSIAERAPADRRILELLAAVEFSARRLEQAERWAQRAEALPGGSPAAMLSRARYHMARGEIGESQDWIVRSLAVRPTTYGYFMRLSSLLHEQGDLEAARTALEKVPPSLLQEDMVALQAFQVAYWSRQFDRAAEILGRLPRDFIEGNSIYYPKAFLIGEALHFGGKTRAAELQYRAALQLVEQRLTAEPNSGRLSLWKAKLLARLGQPEEARRFADAAGELGVEFARWSALWRAEVAVLLGRVDEAIAASEKAMEGTAYRSYTLTALRYEPVFDPLRKDPRFQAVIADGLKWLDGMKVARKVPTPIDELSTDGLRPATSVEKSVPTDKSVAVLAFADNSPGHDSEYFSDGISEELINALGKVPGLKVPARTSSFFFKGKNVPVPEIAKQLGVAYVIEGSVQRAGDKVKISARLSKAADGFQVWTDTFLRDAKDVFAVEEEIAGLIAKNLSLKLGVSSAAATASVNPRAFELYTQARQAWNLRTLAGFDRAEDLLNQALVLEPKFARAHAALADVWGSRGSQSGLLGVFEMRNSAEQTRVSAKAQEALGLDSESAEAHAALGIQLWYCWDFAGAEREMRRAIGLNPNYASAHQGLGRVLECEGQMDEALAELKLATEIDPFSAVIAANYGGRLFEAGRFSEAIRVLDRALVLQPGGTAPIGHKADALLGLGRKEEAVSIVRQLEDGDVNSRFLRIRILAAAGLRDEAGALLADYPEKTRNPRSIALLALGRREEALARLDAGSFSVNFVGYVMGGTFYDLIRGEPRFAQFLAALGLTEAHARAQAWRKAHPPEKPTATK